MVMYFPEAITNSTVNGKAIKQEDSARFRGACDRRPPTDSLPSRVLQDVKQAHVQKSAAGEDPRQYQKLTLTLGDDEGVLPVWCVVSHPTQFQQQLHSTRNISNHLLDLGVCIAQTQEEQVSLQEEGPPFPAGGRS
jgi:hypothetical protein